jgi:transposase
VGASAVCVTQAGAICLKAPWLARMLARKPRMLVIVALANKMARTAWALLARNEVYRAPTAAA